MNALRGVSPEPPLSNALACAKYGIQYFHGYERMVEGINFYLDDSGTRRPNHDPGKRAEHGHDWFALGGVLVRDKDEADARALRQEFCHSWDIRSPLHSSEIRARNENFLWLEDLSKPERKRFYEELYQMMKAAPVIGLACVIDRPGYNHRYFEKYGRNPWSLCKTAFAVGVERAAKYARSQGSKLRVFPERCNKPEDDLLKSYYKALRETGMPFESGGAEHYAPLTAEEFRETLYDFKIKAKSSPMAQFADLYLWPMCMGGYRASTRPYARLMEDGKLIECHIPGEAWSALGTKYSCFDLVEREP